MNERGRIAINLDEIDMQILSILMSNSRESSSSIAKTVNISLTAVIRRIQKLEDYGVISNYTVTVNPEKIGLTVHGILIGGVYKVFLSEFYKYISQVDEIVRCETIISGGKEVFLEFYFKNINELMAFYESGIRRYLDSMTVYLLMPSSSVHQKPLPIPKNN